MICLMDCQQRYSSRICAEGVHIARRAPNSLKRVVWGPFHQFRPSTMASYYISMIITNSSTNRIRTTMFMPCSPLFEPRRL